jgi:hypothetical protein
LGEISLEISKDRMTARLKLGDKDDGPYTKDDVMSYLRKRGVKAGINEEAIEEMLASGNYYQYVEVATGRQPTQGTSGRYEYYFDTTTELGIPTILPNGNVDYSRIIEVVNMGDLLAKYIPEVKGSDGFNVTGMRIRANRTSSEPPLICRSVRREGNMYYAAAQGQVMLKGKEIIVHQTLEIPFDLTNTYGNVDFNGNVHIKGNVASNMIVRAQGSVTIDGTVEAARIEAGENIVIGYGVQGNENAQLIAGNDVVCNFIESAYVEAENDVKCESIISSYVTARGRVSVTHKRGVICGGSVAGMLGVEANVVGNRNEVATDIYVGATQEQTEFMGELRTNISKRKSTLSRLKSQETALEKLETYERTSRHEEKAVEVLREQLEQKQEVEMEESELNRIMDEIRRAQGAMFTAYSAINKGVRIYVSGQAAKKYFNNAGATFRMIGADILVGDPVSIMEFTPQPRTEEEIRKARKEIRIDDLLAQKAAEEAALIKEDWIDIDSTVEMMTDSEVLHFRNGEDVLASPEDDEMMSGGTDQSGNASSDGELSRAEFLAQLLGIENPDDDKKNTEESDMENNNIENDMEQSLNENASSNEPGVHHILVVDDDKVVLKQLRELLRDEYKISLVDSGKMALKFLEKNRPDLILLDYMMPDMDGFQTLEQIRTNTKYQNIPVVFLSGMYDVEKIQNCLNQKIQGWVSKPVSGSELKDKLKEVFGEPR